MYIVGNSVPIISSTKVQNPSLSQLCVVLTVDHLFSYQVTGACVRTDPRLIFYLTGRLFKLSSEHCLISTQNLCHMDLWSV
jgi:hypothetical protein